MQQQVPNHSRPAHLPLKPKIDPNQIPSPVQAQLQDQSRYHQQEYGTCSKEPLPLATTSFSALDQGNCGPHFMRSTLRDIPASYDLWHDSGLPMGLVIQPLANVYPKNTFPLAPTSSQGPIRCQQCMGYINPWCRFIDGGRKFMCNLCESENPVPEEYFCYMDMTGKRADREERPELRLGSVEFEVPEEYWTRPPTALCVVFALDVSLNAVNSGVLESVCRSIKSTLGSLEHDTKVAIMTFDSTVCFYNLMAHLDQAHMMVVSDCEDMFLPLSEGFLVDPYASKRVIEDLLDRLPSMYAHTTVVSSVMGAAIQGAFEALKVSGGKLHLFQTVLPSMGPGALKHKEDDKPYATEKEKQFFQPQSPFYATIGKECVQKGICVDLWLFPSSSMEMNTLGVLSALTGGDTHSYPDFDKTHSEHLVYAVQHSLTREQGYNAALRVRCSNGISVEDQYGNFDMQNATDILLAGIDADKSIGFDLKHDAKLTEGSNAYFQCALLYTTVHGQRRVRVHTLCLSITQTMSTIFRQADVETSMSLIVKRAISQTIHETSQEISSKLDIFCVKILAAYRKYCAASTATGQLVLPESFKILPVYLLAFKKSVLLRKDTKVTSDMRVHAMRLMKSCSIAATIQWLYPRVIKVIDMLSQVNIFCGGSMTYILPLERPSYAYLNSTGIYLVEDHHFTFLWIGQHVSIEYLQGIFGVSQLEHIDPSMTQLPQLDHPFSKHLQQHLRRVRMASPKHARIFIIRQSVDPEYLFYQAMMEDASYGQLSYVDYLCMIHKYIQSEVNKYMYTCTHTPFSYLYLIGVFRLKRTSKKI
ncbi:Sec23/Sec24 trunk domain-containing protein [Spinellus fusiger]|nr:Sec23/Sec24 trunk domain-containing protein [Spinellus fusiger]